MTKDRAHGTSQANLTRAEAAPAHVQVDNGAQAGRAERVRAERALAEVKAKGRRWKETQQRAVRDELIAALSILLRDAEKHPPSLQNRAVETLTGKVSGFLTGKAAEAIEGGGLVSGEVHPVLALAGVGTGAVTGLATVGFEVEKEDGEKRAGFVSSSYRKLVLDLQARADDFFDEMDVEAIALEDAGVALQSGYFDRPLFAKGSIVAHIAAVVSENYREQAPTTREKVDAVQNLLHGKGVQ